MRYSTLAAAIASIFIWSAAAPVRLAAQAGASAPAATPAKAPRMADGHPDLSGVWWPGNDIGGRPAGGRGGGAGRGAGRGPAAPTFTSLYQPAAQAHAKTLSDKDDPSLDCVPTALGTFNTSLFDVGAVGQIVQTPKFVIMLTETYHGFQIVPTDGRPHRDNIPPANRGDAVGHWEGDILVVDKTNFTDTSWMSAEGRVSYHSDALHIVERYHRVDADTLEVETRVEDPKVLTGPWMVPKQTLRLAPFDQIMELGCSAGDVKALIEGASQPSGK